MPTGPSDHDYASAVGDCDGSGEDTRRDCVTDRDDPDPGTGAACVAGTADAVSSDPWLALLDIVAAGDLRLTLTAPSGQRVVVVAEEELAALRAAATAARTRPVVLTPRERQVLQRVAAGDSLTEASAQLGLSMSTVSQHLASARRKYGVHTTARAVALAREASHLT